MSKTKALRKIQKAKINNATELYLSHSNLEEIPIERERELPLLVEIG